MYPFKLESQYLRLCIDSCEAYSLSLKQYMRENEIENTNLLLSSKRKALFSLGMLLISLLQTDFFPIALGEQ